MPTKPPADTEPDDLDATFGDPRGDDLIDDDRSGDLLELTEGERPARPGMKQLALLGAGLLGALVAVALLIGLFVSLADPTRHHEPWAGGVAAPEGKPYEYVVVDGRSGIDSTDTVYVQQKPEKGEEFWRVGCFSDAASEASSLDTVTWEGPGALRLTTVDGRSVRVPIDTETGEPGKAEGERIFSC